MIYPLLLLIFAKISQSKEILVCGPENTLEVACTNGNVLIFEEVIYGRQDSSTCSNRGLDTHTECRLLSALAMVHENCFKKRSCVIHFQNTFIPDPCPGTDKYLQARYECVPEHSIITMCDNYFIKDLSSGYIISPNYPNHYNPHMKCTSEIIMENNLKSRLELLDLEVEARESRGCYDWLILQEKGSAAEKYDYCGTLTTVTSPKILTFTSAVVKFMPDQMNNYRGFIIRFEAVAQLNNDNNQQAAQQHVIMPENRFNRPPKYQQKEPMDEEDYKIKELQESLRILEQKKQERLEQKKQAEIQHRINEEKRKLEAEMQERRAKEEADRKEREEILRQKRQEEQRLREFEEKEMQRENQDSFGRPERYAKRRKQRSPEKVNEIIYEKGCVQNTVDVPKNGHIVSLREGRRVLIECDEGFSMEDEDSGLLVCHDDRWSGEAGFCVAQTCTEPAAPEHGEVIYRKINVGSDVEYICHKGYVLVGQRSQTCLSNAKWSGTPPYCSKGGIRSLSFFGELVVAVILTLLFMFFRKRCWPLKLTIDYFIYHATRPKPKAIALTY